LLPLAALGLREISLVKIERSGTTWSLGRSGDGYARHSDGSYLKGQLLYTHIGEPDPHVPEISRFLRWLACYVSPYYDRALRRTANNEDLYYLVGEIYDEEAGNLDNPLVFDAQHVQQDS
jgi:hypothetical protein